MRLLFERPSRPEDGGSGEEKSSQKSSQNAISSTALFTASTLPFPSEDDSASGGSASAGSSNFSYPSPQEVSLLSTFFPVTPAPAPAFPPSTILGYSPEERSTFDLNGGTSVETIMRLFKEGGIGEKWGANRNGKVVAPTSQR
jgi:hypothetical protein